MAKTANIHASRPLSVGELAARSGVAVSTVHFYEAKGLIRGWRSTGNQRRYGRDVLRRVAIIKVAQRLGLPLSTIKQAIDSVTLEKVNAYLKSHDATVGAFYLSNVEQYLAQDGKMPAFCRSVATLPLDGTSTFIRSNSGRGGGFGFGFVQSLGSIAAETRACAP